jgi:hypothetical protein
MAGKGTVGQLLVEMRADLGKLRLDVKEMEKTFQSSFTNIQNQATNFARGLAAGFASAFSVGAIISYTKQIVALGGQLKDLSQQTGISGQTLSGLKSTLEENGTSLDAFAKGIFTLQKNIGGIKNDSDPAAQAIKQLGLNLDELRKTDTETFLQLVTDALGKVENPLNRAALSAALLAKGARELGPALNEMAGRLAELRKGGLSDSDIDLIDQFGDAWTRTNNKIKLAAAEGLAFLIRDLSNIKFLFDQMFNKSAAVGALLGGGAGAVAERAKPTAPFTPPVDEAAIKKAAEEIKNMIEALQKSNAALQAQIIELNSGKEAAQNYTLQQQEVAENAKHITAAITAEQQRRRELTDQLRLEGLAREDLHRLAEQSRKDTPLIEESTRFGLTPEQQREFNEDQARTDQQKIEARKQIIQLEQKLGLALVPEENDARRIQELKTEFGNLALQIAEVGREAGLTEDQINSLITTAEAGTLKSIESIKSQADKLGEEVANSLTSGLKNTLLGIETGDQSISQGMKNLLRNMMLELQGAVFDKTILEPLKAIAAGFISGLVGALDDAANTQLKNWAKDLGKQVSSWLGSGLSSIFGSGLSFGSAGAAGPELLAGPGFARGGMIPSFASGGLFIGHGGEFVMQKKAVDNIGADTLGMMNKTGKVPGSGGSVVNVEINGDITPRQPNLTPDQVVKVTAGNITNDGMVMSAIEQRLRLRGR